MFDINKIKKLLKKWVLKLILQMQRQKTVFKDHCKRTHRQIEYYSISVTKIAHELASRGNIRINVNELYDNGLSCYHSKDINLQCF